MNEDERFLDDDNTINFEDINKKADAGIRWSSISLTYLAMIQISMSIILAQLFTPKEYGIMGLILIILGIGMLFSDVGVSGAIIHYQRISKSQLYTLFWFSFIISILIFIILNLLSSVISIFFNEPKLTPLIQITSIIFLIIPFGQQFETLLKKKLEFKSLAYIEILNSTILAIISILLAYYGWGVVSIVIGYILKSLVKSILMFFIGLKIWKPKFKICFSGIRNYLSFGLYQMGERSLNFFNLNIDKILIGKFLGATSLGYYNIAYNLTSYPINLFNKIFTLVSFPYFSKMQNNIKVLKERYFDLIEIISFINFPIYFFLILISPYLIPLLYGTQWYPSIILVQILSIANLFRCIGNPIGSLLLAKGYAKLGFLWNIIATIIYPLMILFGIFIGGINGAAIFILFSYLILFYLFYYFLLKRIFGPCLKEYLRSFGMNLLFSFSAFSVSLLGGEIYQTQLYLFKLFLYISIGIIVYFSLIIIFKKQFLIEFIKRFLKKH